MNGNHEQNQAHAAQAHVDLPPDGLIIIPVRNFVLFPGMVSPLSIGRAASIAGAQEAARSERPVGIILQRDPASDMPRPDELYKIGTMASIVRYITTPEGNHHIVCQGLQRFGALEFIEGMPFYAARTRELPDKDDNRPEVQALLVQLRERSSEIVGLLPQVPPDVVRALQAISSPAAFADFVAGLMDISPEEKQDVLETLDVQQRLEKVLTHLNNRIEVLRLSRQINEQTRRRMDDRQREFMLREQMKTIQSQLGEDEGGDTELADLREGIIRAHMPEDTEAHALKEMRRLEKMSDASAEYSMMRTYLEWLTELPWDEPPQDAIDLKQAREILDQEHFGLERIKRRILEFLAVRKLNPHGKSPILCFVGPPGVGKTSLGQSIAHATGRKFVRVSLGGVHDEAEIRGHRRTYVGALPGNIIQAVRKAGTRNCVMMLDEVDKIGISHQGDPNAALLEVLDPEQNSTFRDNYLAVPYDLSKVLFLCTANMLDTMPGPLRDRLEIISLPGYTGEEKLQIARRYLLPRQLAANGLSPAQVTMTDAALHTIIHDYTREAGVRNLEREIGAVFRNVAVRIAEGTVEHVTVDSADIPAILGPEKFQSEVALRTSLPGVATGLAWTPVGGDILFVEASQVLGSGRLILTGQLGEVMKESAQAALTLLKSHASTFGLGTDVFRRCDVHVHVPAGAIPKDGPSAGVAIFLALASLAMGTPVRNDVAMTGEISLRGLVLPVGGIKEKVLAALRAGIKTVMLPMRNQKELEEIPEDARNQLQFVWLNNVDEAVIVAIGTPAPRSAGAAPDTRSPRPTGTSPPVWHSHQ